MKVLSLIVALVALAALGWQHLRYLDLCRHAAQDRQPMVYGPNTFHLILFLRTEDDSDPVVLDALEELKRATQGLEGLGWIYAGKVAANGEASRQLGRIAWTACVVLQFDSRADYDRAAAGSLGTALAGFAEVHAQGFDRPLIPNLLLPQGLGLRRLVSILRREPSAFPFVPHEGEPALPEAAELARSMLAGESLSSDATVVFNLQTAGTREQQANDAAYVGRMMRSMAEGGYGPIHMGRAVRVSGDAEFQNIALVFYPGVRFFAEMIQSEFFQGIVGDKQLGDNQSTITVPVLDRL